MPGFNPTAVCLSFMLLILCVQNRRAVNAVLMFQMCFLPPKANYKVIFNIIVFICEIFSFHFDGSN